MAGKPGPVDAGALDPNTLDRAELDHPRGQQLVPFAGGRERLDPQHTTIHVDDRSDVHIAVRVDPTNDQTR